MTTILGEAMMQNRLQLDPLQFAQFIPMSYEVAKGVGAYPAVVHGAIYAYCHSNGGQCAVSLGHIAHWCHMSRRTARRCVQRLIEASFIEDLTPDRINRPHVYRDAGKVLMDIGDYDWEWMKEAPPRTSRGSQPKTAICNKLRWEVWQRDDFTCQHCGARKYLEIDHIVPESKGGAMTLDNLQTLCRPCNLSKGDRMP